MKVIRIKTKNNYPASSLAKGDMFTAYDMIGGWNGPLYEVVDTSVHGEFENWTRLKVKQSTTWFDYIHTTYKPISFIPEIIDMPCCNDYLVKKIIFEEVRNPIKYILEKE